MTGPADTTHPSSRIPTGSCPTARGCPANRATPGIERSISQTLKGFCPVNRRTEPLRGSIPFVGDYPGVGPSAQPRASGQNPFGVQQVEAKIPWLATGTSHFHTFPSTTGGTRSRRVVSATRLNDGRCRTSCGVICRRITVVTSRFSGFRFVRPCSAGLDFPDFSSPPHPKISVTGLPLLAMVKGRPLGDMCTSAWGRRRA